MKINKRGYWENKTTIGHGVDKNLAIALRDFFHNEVFSIDISDISVIDIGAGTGFYASKIASNFVTVECWDGNPYTKRLSKGLCKVADFSKPQNKGVFDWALCLEVGEHIPEIYEDVFIQNLKNHCRRGIVMSWAVPGQGGDGHVNCRTNEYVRFKICSREFKYDVTSTNALREKVSPYPETGWWFKDTLMIFRRF